jgi:hypothetical protein
MLNICGIVVAILKMATGRNFSMSAINSGHHYLPTYQIQIQHCPISMTFHMWVDYDVSKNFYQSPSRINQKVETMYQK